MTDEILKMVCPNCKETLRVKKPAESGRHTYRCPKCQKVFAIDVKADESRKAEEGAAEAPAQPKVSDKTQQKSTTGDIMNLFVRRRLLSDKQLKLKVGSNTIGSTSEDKPSDIMIDDSYISRRSATIDLEFAKDNTFKYLFTLQRTTNPAYYNGKLITPGTSFYMKDGDEFQLGKTKFYIKRGKSL